MSNSVEFHDSTLSAISQEGTSVRVSLDAYVHRWNLVEGVWKGTGWMQPVQIIVGSGASAMMAEVPVDLDGGEVRTVDRTHDNLVPLPFTSSGPVSLRLELVTGEVLKIDGRNITIDPAGNARYVEDLPDDFRPSDAG
jgi:hypothetical protein